MEKCVQCGKPMNRRIGDHHMLECGLENVWLLNVPIWECPNGHWSYDLHNPQGVTKEIGRRLLEKREPLNGREIRFLRKGMRLSALNLAKRMGVTNVAVSRWENEAHPISPTADRLLRMLYAAHMGIKAKALAEAVFPEIAPNHNGESERLEIESFSQCGG